MAARPSRSRLVGSRDWHCGVRRLHRTAVRDLARRGVGRLRLVLRPGPAARLHHAHHVAAHRRGGVRASGVRDSLHEHARRAADGSSRRADRPAGGHARAAADVHRPDPRQHGPDPGQGDSLRLARPRVPQRRRDVGPLADVPSGALRGAVSLQRSAVRPQRRLLRVPASRLRPALRLAHSGS